MNRNTTRQYEDGKKTSAQETSNENVYLRLDRPVTPALSYQLYIRTTITDTHATDAAGQIRATYQRAAEPAIDLFLRNPMYSLDTGYRRLEQWSTAHIGNDSRKTSDFYYSRLNVTPFEFPSLLLQFDRQKDYDHVLPNAVDTTTNRYSGSSGYRLPYKNLDLSYNLYYTRTTTDTPLSTTFKSSTDNFSGMYNIGYTKSFKEGRYAVSAVYQGNYARNKNQQFFTRMTGSASVKRQPLQGLYAKGKDVEDGSTDHQTGHPENMNRLSGSIPANPGLVVPTVPTAVNIGQNAADPKVNEFYNIGIQLLDSEKTVDTISLYVQQTADTINTGTDSLTNPANWKAYWSNENSSVSNTWNALSIASAKIEITNIDALNHIYRINIKVSPQKAAFFKVVNMNTADVTNVFVTGIEAYGTDTIPESGKSAAVVTLFNQGLNFNVNMRPTSKLNFSLNYMINRTDTNPQSIADSASGIFKDVISKSTQQNDNSQFRSNITKTYGGGATWMAHRLLTTTVRLQRNETYDNKKQMDTSSNIYSIAFSSAPLPTLSTNLSFIRNDNFSFGVKQSTNDSVFLNIGSKLYRDVNMTTDVGFTKTQSFMGGAGTSNSRYVRGTIDASLTPKLFSTFIYGFNWTDTGGKTSKTEEGSTIITYRPSRLVNLSGNFSASNTDGKLSSAEGFLVDWLPLRVLKVNFNYQHSRTEPGPSLTDSFNNYAIWYITKFLDLQVAFGFTETTASGKTTQGYNLGINLNCRFW